MLSGWHAYTGEEIDAVIGDAQTAIEIKSTEHVDLYYVTDFFKAMWREEIEFH